MPINTPIDEPSDYEDMFNDALKNINKKHFGRAPDISQIGEEVNKSDKSEPANNILVVSQQDNLTHNYFHYFDLYWDARDCQSNAILRMPKTTQQNINYWISYQGNVTVYFGNNIKSEFKDGDRYYDNENLSPVFTGEIGHVKEYYNQIEVQVISIGKRFKQKIPQEFREAFIYNQNVRDAFQAICEFLGVKFICPPKTESAEDEEEDSESALTDGNENNVSDKVKTENQMASIANKKVEKSKKKKKNNTKTKNNKKNNTKSVNTISDLNGATTPDNEATDEESEDDLTNNEEIDTPQNGYVDIAFDSAGYITHGSTVIETSPDMAETLIAMDEHPFEKYTEDETGIVEDIKRLMAGELFEELHNNIMDYNAITIEPKAAASSEMSTTNDTTSPNSNAAGGSQTNSSGSSGSSGSSNSNNNNNSNNNSNYSSRPISWEAISGRSVYATRLPGNHD